MAITAHWYTLALQKAANNTLWTTTTGSWTADTINVALTTVTYVPNQDTDSFFSNVTNELATAGGYTAGGATLGGKSVGAVTGSHEIPLIAANTVWTSASFTCQRAVIYRSTGTAATSPLLGWVDFGGAETVASGTFTIQWDATNGVLALSAA